MLKEMGNGLQAQRVHVFRLLPLGVDGQDLVDRHCQHFAVLTGFVFHFQDADGAARHDHARDQGHRGDDQHVHRVAVAADGFGHIAVVGGVMHGRAHEAVHKNGAGGFVHLVFHRIGVHRDFDDHVEGIGDIFTRGDVV